MPSPDLNERPALDLDGPISELPRAPVRPVSIVLPRPEVGAHRTVLPGLVVPEPRGAPRSGPRGRLRGSTARSLAKRDRMNVPPRNRPKERFAAEVLRRVLGIEVVGRDDGSVDRMADVSFRLPDGRDGPWR